MKKKTFSSAANKIWASMQNEKKTVHRGKQNENALSERVVFYGCCKTKTFQPNLVALLTARFEMPIHVDRKEKRNDAHSPARTTGCSCTCATHSQSNIYIHKNTRARAYTKRRCVCRVGWGVKANHGDLLQPFRHSLFGLCRARAPCEEANRLACGFKRLSRWEVPM